MTEPLQVLFVCTANICRSPAMELIARELAGDADVDFSSAGTHALRRPADEPRHGGGAARRRWTRRLPQPPAHRRRCSTDADLVLTAEAAHRQLHPRRLPAAATARSSPSASSPRRSREHARRSAGASCVAAVGRTRRTPPRPEHDVADPYRRGEAAAAAATGTIDCACCSVIVPRLTGAPTRGGRA